MELLRDILVSVLAKEETVVDFPALRTSCAEVVERESYKALKKIKTIIENDSLSDFECVEEIICVFESIGSTGGNRHDF